MSVHQAKRRRALKMAGLVLLSGSAAQLAMLRQASAGGAGAVSNLPDFVAISQALTGRQDLNPALAAGLYRAFQLATPDFDASLVKLKAALAPAAVLAGDTTAFTEQQKGEHTLSQAILQAWYLGVVGKGKKSVCITYSEALSNRVVADKLEPPSFSYGPCGSWQAKP